MSSLTGELNYTSIGRTVDINTDDYYTKAETDNAIKEVEMQLKDYAKISYVNEQILNIKIPDVDLSDYYTKSEVNDLIPDTTGYALKSEIPDVSGFTTMNAVEAKGYQTEAQVNTLINTALGVIENGSY